MSEVNISDRTAMIYEIEQNSWETWSTYGHGPGWALHEEEDAPWLETRAHRAV